MSMIIVLQSVWFSIKHDEELTSLLTGHACKCEAITSHVGVAHDLRWAPVDRETREGDELSWWSVQKDLLIGRDKEARLCVVNFFGLENKSTDAFETYS